MRVRFPKHVTDEADLGWAQTRRISVVLNGNSDASVISSDENGVTWITGYTKKNSGILTPPSPMNLFTGLNKFIIIFIFIGGVPSTFAHFFALGIFTGEAGDKPAGKPIDSYAGMNVEFFGTIFNLLSTACFGFFYSNQYTEI